MKTLKAIVFVTLMSIILLSCQESPVNPVSEETQSQTLIEQMKIYGESNLEKKDLQYELHYCYQLEFKEVNLQDDIQEINIFLYNDHLLTFSITMNPYPGSPMVRSGINFDFRIRPQGAPDIQTLIDAFENDNFSFEMEATSSAMLEKYQDSRGESAISGFSFATENELEKNIQSFWQDLLTRNDLPDISTESGIREFIDILVSEIKSQQDLFTHPEIIE